MPLEGGLERRAVTTEEIRSIEPALQRDLYAGYYTESDFTGDIHSFSRKLSAACEDMGYFGPNKAARSLRQGKSNIVALIEENNRLHEEIRSTFVSDMLRLIS
mgnify:CR=1 FL=1